MPQITLLNTSAPRRGTSSYSSTGTFLLGTTTDYTMRGRVGWDALDPTWQITSIKLYMNRTDGYAGKTLKVGGSTDGAWGASLAWSSKLYAAKGTGAKSWDLTAYKDILQAYAGMWYLHFGPYSGSDPSYCEWTGGSGSSGPRLVVVYEESSLTVPDDQFTIGVQSAIMVGNAGSGLTHKLSYSIGSASGALAGGAFITAGATVNWTPDAALANQIPDDMVGDVTLTLTTYLSGVLQSTRALTYPLNVPASYVPTISSAPLALQNPAGDTIGVYVQGRSWAKCTVTAASVYGASIVEYRLTIGGVTYSSPTNVITTGVLAQYGVLSGMVTVVDSRGQMATYTNAATMTATVYQYFAPIVTAISVMRCTAGGVVSNVGTYIKYVLSVSFAPINNLNTKAGTLKLKLAGGEYGSSVAMSAIPTYGATVTGVIGAGGIGAAGYVVSASLTDKYSTTIVEAELASSKIWFDLHSSGEGMAVGKVAEEADLFDVGIAGRFRAATQFDVAPTFADPAAVLAELGVQWGSAAYSLSSTSATSYTVTFPAPYAAPPNVMLTMGGTTSWTRSALGVILCSVSTTSMVVRVMNGYSGSRAGSFYWRAEGVLA